MAAQRCINFQHKIGPITQSKRAKSKRPVDTVSPKHLSVVSKARPGRFSICSQILIYLWLNILFKNKSDLRLGGSDTQF